MLVVLPSMLSAGFDPRAAAIVMGVVRAVACAGHTVMVTIHQPSINIFESFDTLLLLQVSRKACGNGLMLCES
jgi:ABC-type multidrug transport system ATPase subunit